ncbi:MAG: phage holin family protein [Bacilli bacterium]|nr:phage holin family protein [Bacilli bacterium]
MKKSKIDLFNNLIEWLIYMLGYALILVLVSLIFKETIYIDSSLYGLWGILASIIIYFLNKTIKPLIVWLTLPITALTLGLFYPFINVLILKITSIILGNHFNINGLFMSFLVAILISIMNMILDEKIIKPLLRGEK